MRLPGKKTLPDRNGFGMFHQSKEASVAGVEGMRETVRRRRSQVMGMARNV